MRFLQQNETSTPPCSAAAEFDAALRRGRRALGDLDLARDSFERLLARGGGSARQRAVHEASGDLAAVVADLTRRTAARPG